MSELHFSSTFSLCLGAFVANNVFSSVLLLSVFLSGSVLAQESTQSLQKQLRTEEMRSSERVARLSSTLTPGQEGFDVTYYKLDLKLSLNPNGLGDSLSGSVTMIAKSLVNNLASITLDLMSSMRVDSVSAGGKRVTQIQQPTLVNINLDRAYSSGEMLTVVVYYRGVPGNSGFGSFNFTTVPGSSSPWVWSLSEPYGAKDWWPCKDHPGDKADSVDVWVTCDSTLKVGSEGKLVSVVNNGNGTRTHRWQHRYPIATYLVSITVCDFSEVSGWFKYNQSDSMQVLDYALPTNVPPGTPNIVSATASMGITLSMLQIYSDLFGLYPFFREKYGFSQFGWGGGMEHQTMTSVVNFDESLLAHETAHQWFGDMITMRTWPHIWLNEGFATYCVALYRERRYGTAAYWDEINSHISPGVKGTAGSVYVKDTSSVGPLFNTNLVYHKGGMVLHMLRHALGDSVFFRAMSAYAQDPRFRFKTASTEDFQSVCEAVSGKPLSYFFSEWIYGEKYPVYRYEWGNQFNGSTYTVRVSLSQTTGTSTPVFFQMPIDFEFRGVGFDTTIVRMNDAQNQTFVFTLPWQPTTFLLDPTNWIVKDASGIVVNIDRLSGNPREFALLQNYPNPFNPSTIIPFELPVDAKVRLEVYNELGELVQQPLSDQILSAGSHTVQFLPVSSDGKALCSGVYFYRLVASGVPIQTRKMLYMR